MISFVWSPSKTLAKPKSQIFGVISFSSKMLLGFKSLCITFTRDSSCRYTMPRAIPQMILYLVSQASCLRFSSSAYLCCVHWSNQCTIAKKIGSFLQLTLDKSNQVGYSNLKGKGCMKSRLSYDSIPRYMTKQHISIISAFALHVKP